jgi:KDO2-lipid IV(A) lauroyltransferase
MMEREQNMNQKPSLKIRIAKIIARMVPLCFRRFAATRLAAVGFQASLKHRLIAFHNLMRAFPEKTTEEIVAIAKASYQSFSLVFAEFPEIIHLNKDNLDRWVSVTGLEHYEAALREGRGVLLITAHFGNWEFGCAALAILSRPPIFMARVLDSDFLEEGSTYVRSLHGVGIIHKDKAMRPMLRLLKNGEAVKLLIDQNVAAYEGVFVNFFGRPACTTAGVALMAMHSGAAVLPIFTTRMPDGRYLTEIKPKVETVITGDRDRDVQINTQNYARILEDHIRKYPDQWLWVHQRWKTKRCQIPPNRTDPSC